MTPPIMTEAIMMTAAATNPKLFLLMRCSEKNYKLPAPAPLSMRWKILAQPSPAPESAPQSACLCYKRLSIVHNKS
jgi:hypothetical protein